MKKLYCLMIGILILSGYGCEGVFSTDKGPGGTITGEEVEMAATGSAGGDSITTDVTLQVGAQILEANFLRYREIATDDDGDFSVPLNNRFASNLERLYHDVEGSIE